MESLLFDELPELLDVHLQGMKYLPLAKLYAHKIK